MSRGLGDVYKRQVCIHISLQILLHKLKDQHELGLRVNHIMQTDHIRVTQLLHQRNLTDGRRGRALLSVKVNILECDNLIRKSRTPLAELDTP